MKPTITLTPPVHNMNANPTGPKKEGNYGPARQPQRVILGHSSVYGHLMAPSPDARSPTSNTKHSTRVQNDKERQPFGPRYNTTVLSLLLPHAGFRRGRLELDQFPRVRRFVARFRTSAKPEIARERRAWLASSSLSKNRLTPYSSTTICVYAVPLVVDTASSVSLQQFDGRDTPCRETNARGCRSAETARQ